MLSHGWGVTAGRALPARRCLSRERPAAKATTCGRTLEVIPWAQQQATDRACSGPDTDLLPTSRPRLSTLARGRMQCTLLTQPAQAGSPPCAPCAGEAFTLSGAG